MNDVERANMVLKKIGEMPYFDPDAIVKVLVNEFSLVREKRRRPTRRAPDYAFCSHCGGVLDEKGHCQNVRLSESHSG